MHVLFFFKQKTAYEMRISDWSSDVCSSDLGKRLPIRQSKIVVQFRGVPHSIFETRGTALKPNRLIIRLQPEESISLLMKLGRASCRERGCQDVSISVVAGALKTKNYLRNFRRHES